MDSLSSNENSLSFDLSASDALRRAEEHADALDAKLKISERAREKAEKEVAVVEGLRQRLQTAEDALRDKVDQQSERENAIVTRLDTQNRKFTSKTLLRSPFASAFCLFPLILMDSRFSSTGRMGEECTLREESDDHLLNTLDILELNCDLARTNISSAWAMLKRFFPHFFPKETQPEIFSELVQRFLAKEDHVFADRQASLKIRVEGTIALVTVSGQEVDWEKADTPKGIKKEKWKTLVRDAKPQSKKIIGFLDPKFTASASTARMEVK
jgi:hypothetical protein